MLHMPLTTQRMRLSLTFVNHCIVPLQRNIHVLYRWCACVWVHSIHFYHVCEINTQMLLAFKSNVSALYIRTHTYYTLSVVADSSLTLFHGMCAFFPQKSPSTCLFIFETHTLTIRNQTVSKEKNDNNKNTKKTVP